jgi:DNA-binding CsgD family transcriptional regulator
MSNVQIRSETERAGAAGPGRIPGVSGPMLRGRASECARLDELLGAVGRGESGALVLRGEAGMGKTALMDYAASQGEGCTVVRAVGVESEMELPFASLHQLCLPLLEGLERLPPPQCDALRTAFGLSSSARPDQFLVGLAVLTLLSDAAEGQPVICLVDDAQWLDRCSAQVLSFVARRLQAESVLMLFAERDQDQPTELAGLPELALEPLSTADARELLAASVLGPLDERVGLRIVAEARGNPLALLELPHGLSSASLAGGFAVAPSLPLMRRVEGSFRRQVDRLPAETQRLLLVAAAEPVGDPMLLWRAAAELGIPIESGAPAEGADLITVGTRVTFRHPLLRSAIYHAASPNERRNVHRALASATDPEVDPDRRAWHRAHAAFGPDEEVAAELELSAGRAQARAGLVASAAFLERSLALTPEPGRRAQRALAAAQAKQRAGAPDAALALLRAAEEGPLDELQRAQVDVVRAKTAFSLGHSRDAPSLLLAAAAQLAPLTPRFARDTYLDALTGALFVGRMAGDVGVAEVARAARAAPAAPAARAADLLLDGLALVITDGYAAGAPLVKRAVSAFRVEDMDAVDVPRWLWLATHAAHDLWDDESWEWLCGRHVRLARQAGALTMLLVALSARVGLHLYAGELAEAALLVEEIEAVSQAIVSPFPRYGALALAAWHGRQADAAALIDSSLEEATARGEGMGWTLIHNAAAVLYNGLGRYEDALKAAERAAEHPAELGFATLVLPELVEAAVRSGESDQAAAALQRLTDGAEVAGTDWALGLEARCRALLSEDEEAEALYRQAIERLGRTRMRMELARGHLLYGEWLRRENRRMDAREQLRTAYEMFISFGADAFAERTRRELMATGEKVRKRSDETRGQLTAQEEQIARLATDGQTNQEIGAQLFLSPRTVEWHLHKVFTKLGVGSRMQLRDKLPDAARTAALP